MGLCILLAVAMVILFFVASIAVSLVFAVLLAGDKTKNQVIGINYGRVADNLPPPSRAVELIKSLGINRVKIYDADPTVLKAMQGSGLRVTIMVPNQEIAQIANNAPNASDEWVSKNVVAWLNSNVKIETVVVGNEILSDSSLRDSTWPKLVPAMEAIRSSLDRAGSKNIPVTTSLAIDCLDSSFPPSTGTFKQDIAETIIKPLLHFLSETNSFFFVNVYPYFALSAQPSNVSLDYALFSPSATPVVDGGVSYHCMLDAQLDALVMAMTRLGYGSVHLAISETGWPSAGANVATVANAATYNRGLVQRILGKAGQHTGTPRRPGGPLSTFIFSLFNEDQKNGAVERSWGLLYPNGSRVYDIDLTGKNKVDNAGSASHSSKSAAAPSPPAAVVPTTPSSASPSPSSSSSFFSQPRAANPGDFGAQKQWCIVGQGQDDQALQGAMEYACREGGNCEPIQPGEACYQPASFASHASYAFNSYWQAMKTSGGTCDFSGAAVLTTVDPSYGSCVYPVS